MLEKVGGNFLTGIRFAAFKVLLGVGSIQEPANNAKVLCRCKMPLAVKNIRR